jgi:uncharacterized phage protein (TIGR02220 family)
MRRGKQNYNWFPLWSDKWIFGSTRHELTHEQRAIWTDLMAIANKDDGFIRANESTPYPYPQLSGLLCAPIELIESTIERCLSAGKLKQVEPGIFYICNWKEYQLSGRYKRLIAGKVEQASAKADASILFLSKIPPILSYFNVTTGQKRKADTGGFISARLAEGRTFEEFKHVIDTKTAQWRDDPKMCAFIRPSTLFRPGNFEDYLNEPYQPPTPAKGKDGRPTKTGAETQKEQAMKAKIESYSKKIWDEITPKIADAQKAGNIKAAKVLSEQAAAEVERHSNKILRGEA